MTAFAASESSEPDGERDVVVEQADDPEREERDRPEERPADDGGAGRLLVEHERARGERDGETADGDRDPALPQPPDGDRSRRQQEQSHRARRAERDRDQLARFGVEAVRVAVQGRVVVRRQPREIVPGRRQHEEGNRDAKGHQRSPAPATQRRRLTVRVPMRLSRAGGRTRHNMSRARVTAVVVALATAGVVLRAWLLSLDVGALDADEAVSGTMARHVLDGEFSAFYWDQSYGGSQEPILTAGVFALTGPSVEALRSVPIILFAVGALLTWRIGVRTVGEPYARFAAGAFWVWSAYVVWKSTRAHGFYGVALVLGLAVVLAHTPARRAADAQGLAAARARARTRLVGDSSGARHRLCPRSPGSSGNAGSCSATRGSWSAPRSSDRSRGSFRTSGTTGGRSRHPPRGGSVVDSIHNLVAATLPTALGARVPFTLEWVGGASRRSRRLCRAARGDRLDAGPEAQATWAARAGRSPSFPCSTRSRRTRGSTSSRGISSCWGRCWRSSS